ncbi:MAG: hypothetical protein O7G85_06435, partial [Planctomycetota bacterium]|nr:hypothetical protein [Planctomycetota bacterium]
MSENPNSLSLDVPGLSVRTKPADLDLRGFDIPHPEPFLCDIEIGREHMSRAIEHVSNIEYVKWLDRAAELHSDSLGYTREV